MISGLLKLIARVLAVVSAICVTASFTAAQVENVPVSHQVYEFLDRMGVKGVLPQYSNTMIPLSRNDVAGFLARVEEQRESLTAGERSYLDRFRREFAHELDPSKEQPVVFFRDGFNDIFSDREKYLYAYADSTATAYVEFVGAAEHRLITGDSYGSTNASFDQYGGRIRGSVAGSVGYYLQSMNGTFYGDKIFALSDPRFRGNVKFNNLNSPYFDYTEAAVRAQFGLFGVEFGREYTLIGTGYSDRLILSDNAPVTDFLKLDLHYKSLRFTFMNAALVADSATLSGTLIQEPAGSNKYLALHRLQFSPFGMVNLGVSEMIIYQRFSPDFAYLNPVNFYKSAEHALRDRDNAFLNFDLELFPVNGYKCYGTWLIDDIDFSKMGTGWWGNEFGWQGGITASDVAGIPDVDLTLEYTRLEPYVYSNRVAGNDFTTDNIGLGHHLQPNSDEWFVQLGYRPIRQVHAWLTLTRTRHGENIVENGSVLKNVGGDVLAGHRDADPESAAFLDGRLVQGTRVQVRSVVEAIRGLILSGVYEFREEAGAHDKYAAFRIQIEY
jgi:hypothetical protein